MLESIKYILLMAFMLALIAGVFAIRCANYDECREKGFSTLYCTTRH